MDIAEPSRRGPLDRVANAGKPSRQASKGQPSERKMQAKIESPMILRISGNHRNTTTLKVLLGVALLSETSPLPTTQMSVFYNFDGNVSMFFKKRHALFIFCRFFLHSLFGAPSIWLNTVYLAGLPSIWRSCRLFGGTWPPNSLRYRKTTPAE